MQSETRATGRVSNECFLPSERRSGRRVTSGQVGGRVGWGGSDGDKSGPWALCVGE
jgi:hypothetical protein